MVLPDRRTQEFYPGLVGFGLGERILSAAVNEYLEWDAFQQARVTWSTVTASTSTGFAQ